MSERKTSHSWPKWKDVFCRADLWCWCTIGYMEQWPLPTGKDSIEFDLFSKLLQCLCVCVWGIIEFEAVINREFTRYFKTKNIYELPVDGRLFGCASICKLSVNCCAKNPQVNSLLIPISFYFIFICSTFLSRIFWHRSLIFR